MVPCLIGEVIDLYKSVTACNDSSNSRTSNENAICAECGTCVFNSNHDAYVSRYLKDVNARPKKPNVVPISASKPKRKANKSVATPHKKTIVQFILFIVDTVCTKHMTGNLKLLCNFVEKFLGTVNFGNDQFAPILEQEEEVQTVIRNKAHELVAKGNNKSFPINQIAMKTTFLMVHRRKKVNVAHPEGFLIQITKKSLPSKKIFVWLKAAPRAWYDELSKLLMSKALLKEQLTQLIQDKIREDNLQVADLR
ncbi:hypothetical protein Tco_0584403 [Tanacetum coccineum]